MAPVANSSLKYRTAPFFSCSGPTIKPGVSHKETIGIANRSHNYDVLGRQSSITRSGHATVSHTYTDLGELKTSKTGSRTIHYKYHDNGQRSRLTHPDNFYINYAFDDAGNLKTINDNANRTLVTYGYNNYGRLSTINRGNGRHSVLDYDAPGRVTDFDHLGVNNASFDYNPASQIVNRAVSSATFQIDVPTIGTENYLANNLNQYTNVGSKTVSYDNNGNLTVFDGWSYVYNIHNRLTTANKSGQSVSLMYDATGRLYRSTVNGSHTYFLYDGDELIAEYNSAGTMLNRYVHGVSEDDPLVKYQGNSTSFSNQRYLLADERGSIIAETNSAGSIIETHQYGPYGEMVNSSASRFRYTGQILIPGTELYYYKARVYHPELGRFMQTDPIGYADGMNWYGYVGNDPVNKFDPTGMALECIAITTTKDICTFTPDEDEDKSDNGPDWGTYAIAGGLIAVDLVLGGPTGEGIVPAMALLAARQGVKKLTKEAAENAAKKLGFYKKIPPQKADFDSMGQPVFTDGKTFITRDVTAHKGGAWKMFDRKGRRIGTFNENLTQKVGK